MADLTDLIGVPFKNRGRSREEGFDCYGLVKEVFRRYGYIIPEYDMQYNYTYMINGMRYATPRIGNNQSSAGEYYHGKICNLAVTIRDIADPSVYENCGFMLDGLVPQPEVEEESEEQAGE